MQEGLSLFGLPIIKIKKTEKYEKRYFLGIQYKKLRQYKDIVDLFRENSLRVKNKTVQIIITNLGEAVFFARTAKFWYKEDALVVGVLAQHVDVFNMFAPDLPIFFVGNAQMKGPVVYDGVCFETVMSSEDIQDMLSQKKPFLQFWEKYLQADFSQLVYHPAYISEETKRSVLKKAELLHINLDNFVFLIPFAQSIGALPEKFWEEIEEGFRKQGYDVIYNSKLFSIPEAYVLAGMAKKIVALRSGFCDVLCELKVPQHIIYQDSIGKRNLQLMYSFKDIPWAAKGFISEYNTRDMKLADIKEQILK